MPWVCSCGGGARGYLDEEAVADVAGLHSVGVRLPDVLLHLEDGPAVQRELPFFLQARRGAVSSRAPSPPGGPAAPWVRRAHGAGCPSHGRRPPAPPTAVHAGPLAEPRACKDLGQDPKGTRGGFPEPVPQRAWIPSPRVAPSHGEDTGRRGEGGSLPTGRTRHHPCPGARSPPAPGPLSPTQPVARVIPSAGAKPFCNPLSFPSVTRPQGAA